MTNGRNNRGSVLLLVVGLLTIIAMLGSTFLISAYMSSQQTSFIASQTTIQPLVMGTLSDFEELMKIDLCVGEYGPYDSMDSRIGGAWGSAPENWRSYADYASPAFDFWLSTTGGSEKDRQEGKDQIWFSMPFGPGAVAISGQGASSSMGAGATGMLGSNSAADQDIQSGVGGFQDAGVNPFVKARSEGLMVDTNGDGMDDAFLNDASVMNSAGEFYYYAGRVTDLSGLICASATAYPDPDRTPYGPYRIDLRRFMGEGSSLYGTLASLRGGSGGESLDTFIRNCATRLTDPDGSYKPFPLSDELFLRINNQANLAAFDESALYDDVGSRLGDRMYDMTVYSASLKWMRHPGADPEDRVRVDIVNADLSGSSTTYDMLSRVHRRVNQAIGKLPEGGDGGSGGGEEEAPGVEYIVDDQMGVNAVPGGTNGAWPAPPAGTTVGYNGSYRSGSSGSFPFYFTSHITGNYKLYIQAPLLANAPSGATVSVKYPAVSGGYTDETFSWNPGDSNTAGDWVYLGQFGGEVKGNDDLDGDNLADTPMFYFMGVTVTIQASPEANTKTPADAVKLVRIADADDGSGGGDTGGGGDAGALGGYGSEAEHDAPGLASTGPKSSAEASHFVANMWSFMDGKGTGDQDGGGYSFNPPEDTTSEFYVGQSDWTAYGVIPQLVISEVYVWMKPNEDEDDGDDSEQAYAIELYNPSDKTVNIENYVLYCGDATPWSLVDDGSTGATVAAGGRIVLYATSHGADGAAPAVSLPGTECPSLAAFFKAPIALYRAVDDMLIPVDSVHGQELLGSYVLTDASGLLEVAPDMLGAMSTEVRADADISLSAVRDDDPDRQRALIPLYVLREEEDSSTEPPHTLGAANNLTTTEIDASELVRIYNGFDIRRLGQSDSIKSVADFGDCYLVGPDNNGWDLPHKLIGQRFKGYITGDGWMTVFQHAGRRYAVTDDGTVSRGKAHIGFINTQPSMYPDVPWATLLAEFIDVAPVNSDAPDTLTDNTTPEEWIQASSVYGRLNINTATTNTLMHLPWPGEYSGGETTFRVDVTALAEELGLNVSGEGYIDIDPGDIASAILAYRDGVGSTMYGLRAKYIISGRQEASFADYDLYTRSSWNHVIDPGAGDSKALRAGSSPVSAGGVDTSGYTQYSVEAGDSNLKVVDAFTAVPGFLTPGEIAIPLAAYMDQRLDEEFLQAGGSMYVAGADILTLRKQASYLDVRDALYASVVDSVTVSSTTFAVTGAVLRGKTVLPGNMEQYMSIIDRTSCMDGSGKPEVLFHIRLDDQIVISD